MNGQRFASALVMILLAALTLAGCERAEPEPTLDGLDAAPSPTVAVPASTTPAPPRPTPGSPAFPYTVQKGDTLSGIAERFGTTMEMLKTLNGLSGEVVTAGQLLIIPGTRPTAAPAGGLTITGASSPTPRQTTYVVKAGDNLYRIGLKFNIPWQSIARANNITDPSSLRAGQTLIIPPQ
ncbi:MAG: LysM peptidoglycan-binding domain-containing protein [Chloroflexi bacterium]|nr:LysM peptidoglycan-binding domain-containing protein [Chloroflexota bacterium]